MIKIFILCAIVLACDGKIEIPGLEDIKKCTGIETECIKINADQITKALSKPYAPYHIQGYEPYTIKELNVANSEYHVDMRHNNFKVTGFGDTKVVKIVPGTRSVEISYEHNFKFESDLKLTFHQDPEVVREGKISGEFVGVISHFTYPAIAEIRDGNVYLSIGQEELKGVELPTEPKMNEQQLSHFDSQPETKSLVQKIEDSPIGFYQPLAEAVVKDISTRIFEDKRNFYKNVPLSDLYNRN